MTLLYYVHSILKDLLITTYPDTYKKYKSFYVKVDFKEKSSNHSRYDFAKKTLYVSTLSRPSSDILISLITELAKHIDIINRQETHDDKVYLGIVKKLIDTALCENLFILQELYKSKNTKLKDKLQATYGSFKYWRFTTNKDIKFLYILAFDAYMIKNLLKNNNYFFDPDQSAWTKLIDIKDYEDELYFIKQYEARADFKIIQDGSFYIRPCYSLCIETYSKLDTEVLKALSYSYDRKSNRWNKWIYADELQIELEMIAEIPKQKVTIARVK